MKNKPQDKKAQALFDICKSIWKSMLKQNLLWARPEFSNIQDHCYISACIPLYGEEKSVCSLNVAPDLAKSTAARMFDQNEEKITDQEVDDALGELLNMIAADSERLFKGKVKIGLPVVFRTEVQQAIIPSNHVEVVINVEYERQAMSVAITR